MTLVVLPAWQEKKFQSRYCTVIMRAFSVVSLEGFPVIFFGRDTNFSTINEINYYWVRQFMSVNQSEIFSFPAALILSLLMLNLSFLHSCILKSPSKIWSLDVKGILTRIQLGSVTLLKDLLIPLSYTFATLLRSGRNWFTYTCLQILILDIMLNMQWIFFCPSSYEIETYAFLM